MRSDRGRIPSRTRPPTYRAFARLEGIIANAADRRPSLLAFCLALPQDLVHHDAARDRDIERGHLSQHRNRDQKIALPLYQVVQTFAFGAEDQSAVGLEIEFVVGLLAALVE